MHSLLCRSLCFKKKTTRSYFKRSNDVISSFTTKQLFYSTSSTNKLKKLILEYYCANNDDFVHNRQEHEKTIKKYINEHNEKNTKGTLMIESMVLSTNDQNIILNNNMSEIKKYVEINYEKNVDISSRSNNDSKLKSLYDTTTLIQILSVCGIKVPLHILYYYLLNTISDLKYFLNLYKNSIIKYDDEQIKQNKTTFLKINKYYYNDDIKDCFFLLYKSISNVFFSLCENTMKEDNAVIDVTIASDSSLSKESTDNTTTMHIEEAVKEYHNIINDTLTMAPAFLNISILFYYINTYLFINRSKQMKSICLNKLNEYINAISDDEIHITNNDFFYLILTTRLYLLIFSNVDVLNVLNKSSKHFLSLVIMVPNNNIQLSLNKPNEKYKYIVDFLNMHEKYVEHKKVNIYPFTFSLVSLKNKIIYIFEKSDDFYLNNVKTLRSYTFWKYFIATKMDFQLLTICTKNEYNDLFSKDKGHDILLKYTNKDYTYKFYDKKQIPAL
ncbi:conserved protein, unknown function [Hepatocystis sp. ex Piliocolobus tephrosceles]|nr:conserved protein, unknown function [Hepatocystis sp. ex Piliocolobus tephrosceles]